MRPVLQMEGAVRAIQVLTLLLLASALTACANPSARLPPVLSQVLPTRPPPALCAPIPDEPVAPEEAKIDTAARRFLRAEYAPWAREGWDTVAEAQEALCPKKPKKPSATSSRSTPVS